MNNTAALPMLNISPRKSREVSSSGKLSQNSKIMTRSMCTKCWCGMMKCSNFDSPSSIYCSGPSILNSQSFVLHHTFSNLLYLTSILHLQLFFLHPQFKVQDIWLKMSSNCPQVPSRLQLNTTLNPLKEKGPKSYFQVQSLSKLNTKSYMYLLWPIHYKGRSL